MKVSPLSYNIFLHIFVFHGIIFSHVVIALGLDIRCLPKGTDFLTIQWREKTGGEYNLPNPYKGMKPQQPAYSYTPQGISSERFNAHAAPFDPKGVYPNLFGSLHPGPEGNSTPTLELIKAKKD